MGDLIPFHCTSVGKAMLAFMSPDTVAGIVGRLGLPAYTPATITTITDLHLNLHSVRNLGYGLDTEEHEIGTFCIGAPIFNDRSRVIGACSVSGTDPEIVGNRLADLLPLAVDTAQRISCHRGFVPQNSLAVLAQS